MKRQLRVIYEQALAHGCHQIILDVGGMEAARYNAVAFMQALRGYLVGLGGYKIHRTVLVAADAGSQFLADARAWIADQAAAAARAKAAPTGSFRDDDPSNRPLSIRPEHAARPANPAIALYKQPDLGERLRYTAKIVVPALLLICFLLYGLL